MQIFSTKPFDKDYAALPEHVQNFTNRKLRMLLEYPHHPSLRIKKMEDPRNIWEGRITKNYRFTFQIENDTYILRRVGPHDILKTP